MRKDRRSWVAKAVCVGLIFMISGAGVCAFGYSMGGRLEDSITVAGIRLNLGFGGSTSVGNSKIAVVEDVSDRDFYNEYESLEKLEINVGVCDIEIIGGNRISLAGSKIESNDVTIDYRNGKLTIKQKSKVNKLSLIKNDFPKLVLTVPSNIALDSADIEYGVGSLSIAGLNVERFDLDVGVGDIHISDMNAERVDIDGGVGTVYIEGLVTERLDVDGGVGETDISGRVDGNITIGGGVGETRLELLNKEAEYDWDVKSGMGHVTLNGKSLSKSYKTGSASDTYKIKVSSGIGSIEIITN